MATICALIPTYNRADMLRECIASVLDQTRQPDEIIVIDDGSTDHTADTVRAFGDRVRLISKTNGGKSAALNTGLAATLADYVWIVDDDDLAAPGGLAHLERALEAHPEAGFVFGTMKKFHMRDGQRITFDLDYWARPEETDWAISFMEHMFIFQPAMLARRRAYSAVGGFDERFVRSQDYNMTLRLLKDFPTAHVPEVIFFQREHDGQRGTAAESFSAAESQKKWLKYDQMLFNWVQENYPLDRFTPAFAVKEPKDSRRRAALVQHAGIFAHRGLWDIAVQDLEEAAAIDAGAATPGELKLMEGLARNELAWALLGGNPALKARLRALATARSRFSRDIVIALTRPLVWQSRTLLKQKQPGEAFKLLRLMYALLGFAGMARRLRLSLT